MKLKLKYDTLSTLNYMWVKSNDIDNDLCSRINKATGRALNNPFEFAHINVSQEDVLTLMNILKLDDGSHSINTMAKHLQALTDINNAASKSDKDAK